MTPYRDQHRGSLILDRTFRGVGRIKRASGLPDTPTGHRRFRKVNAMLTDLWEAGRHDVLARIRDGTLHPLEVWAKYLAKTLDKLPEAELLTSLKAAGEHWLRTSQGGEHTQRARDQAVRLLCRLNPTAQIPDLPELVRAYRAQCVETAHPRAFNMARQHWLVFLRDRFGRRHELYLATQDIPRMRERPKRKRGLTLAEARAVKSALPEPIAAMFWTLCLTGMRPGEYFPGRWEVREDRLLVHGTKTRAAERVVPLALVPVGPQVSDRSFRAQLNRYKALKLEPYTARRTFAGFMELADIPRVRRQIYLGHGTRDVTDLYERQHLTAYLREDARALQHLLGLGIQLVAHDSIPDGAVRKPS